LPPSETVNSITRNIVGQVVGERGRIGIVGLVLLVWVSTRMIGSLRSALRAVFDVREDRGIIAGKIFGMKMVVVAGTLFVANTAITVGLEAAQTYGIELLELYSYSEVVAIQNIFAQILAYAFILLIF